MKTLWLTGLLLALTWDLPATEWTPALEAKAKKLYTGKCARCHRLYPETGYTKEDWERWRTLMFRKTKLRPADAELLRQYTDLTRQRHQPSKQP